MKEDEKMIVKSGMEKEYEDYVTKNQDGYGNCVVVATARVGKALSEGKSLKESHDAMHSSGLTGFMAGCLAQSIHHFHERGEEFRVFWNKMNGIKDEKAKGVVNPALFTIGDKE